MKMILTIIALFVAVASAPAQCASCGTVYAPQVLVAPQAYVAPLRVEYRLPDPVTVRETVTVQRIEVPREPVIVTQSEKVIERQVLPQVGYTYGVQQIQAVQAYGVHAAVVQHPLVQKQVVVHSPIVGRSAVVVRPSVIQQDVVQRRGLFGRDIVRSRTVVR
jgi:hypothetical protein